MYCTKSHVSPMLSWMQASVASRCHGATMPIRLGSAPPIIRKLVGADPGLTIHGCWRLGHVRTADIGQLPEKTTTGLPTINLPHHCHHYHRNNDLGPSIDLGLLSSSRPSIIAMAGTPSSHHKPRRKFKKAGDGHSFQLSKSETLIRAPAFPLAAFLWPARGSVLKWEVLPLVLMVVGLFRWAAGLWGYSGKDHLISRPYQDPIKTVAVPVPTQVVC